MAHRTGVRQCQASASNGRLAGHMRRVPGIRFDRAEAFGYARPGPIEAATSAPVTGAGYCRMLPSGREIATGRSAGFPFGGTGRSAGSTAMCEGWSVIVSFFVSGREARLSSGPFPTVRHQKTLRALAGRVAGPDICHTGRHGPPQRVAVVVAVVGYVMARNIEALPGDVKVAGAAAGDRCRNTRSPALPSAAGRRAQTGAFLQPSSSPEGRLFSRCS